MRWPFAIEAKLWNWKELNAFGLKSVNHKIDSIMVQDWRLQVKWSLKTYAKYSMPIFAYA